jgi:hypothetical protein
MCFRWLSLNPGLTEVGRNKVHLFDSLLLVGVLMGADTSLLSEGLIVNFES